MPYSGLALLLLDAQDFIFDRPETPQLEFRVGHFIYRYTMTGKYEKKTVLDFKYFRQNIVAPADSAAIFWRLLEAPGYHKNLWAMKNYSAKMATV